MIIAQQRLATGLEDDQFHHLRDAFLVGAQGGRGGGRGGGGGGAQETALGALSITQVPRMDVSLADLLDKTGVVPEGMIGALVLQLLPTLHLLHTVCRCVHNDLDARNIFVCCSTGAVRLSGFCYGTNSQKCFI